MLSGRSLVLPFSLLALVFAPGCTTSEAYLVQDASSIGTGSGGSSGMGTGGGSGGSSATGSGGTTATGSGGTTATGSGGVSGTGTGGSGGGGAGTGGSADAGGVIDTARDVGMEQRPPEAGAGDAVAAAPTFTELYTEIFGTAAATASSCAGADCHNPGKKDMIDVATKALAHSTMLTKIMPGNPTGSVLMTRLTTTNVMQRMPLNKPALSAAAIAKVRAWIMAGAKND